MLAFGVLESFFYNQEKMLLPTDNKQGLLPYIIIVTCVCVCVWYEKESV